MKKGVPIIKKLLGNVLLLAACAAANCCTRKPACSKPYKNEKQLQSRLTWVSVAYHLLSALYNE
jgi:hypothetical protein